MTIEQAIIDLTKASEDYLEKITDMRLDKRARNYFSGKYRGLLTAISYLKLIQENK